MVDIKGVLASMVYNFFDKKTYGDAVKNETGNVNMSNQELPRIRITQKIKKYII